MKQGGFFNEIGASIFESGANNSVVIATNCIFGVLIVTLCALMLLWSVNIHLIFITVLAVGLMISINWSVLSVAVMASPLGGIDIYTS